MEESNKEFFKKINKFYKKSKEDKYIVGFEDKAYSMQTHYGEILDEVKDRLLFDIYRSSEFFQNEDQRRGAEVALNFFFKIFDNHRKKIDNGRQKDKKPKKERQKIY